MSIKYMQTGSTYCKILPCIYSLNPPDLHSFIFFSQYMYYVNINIWLQVLSDKICLTLRATRELYSLAKWLLPPRANKYKPVETVYHGICSFLVNVWSNTILTEFGW